MPLPEEDNSVLKPFFLYFSDLAEKEGRILWALGREPGRDDPFGLVDFYCTDPKCDCNRVLIGVVDHTQRSFRTILSVSYAFDRNDPDAGPFIDPLNPATEDGLKLFPLIKEILETDRNYVERLKRHYQMMKGASDLSMEGKILDNGQCVCGICGKKGKQGSTIMPAPQRQTSIVMCVKCTNRESAARHNISPKDAAQQRRRMFQTNRIMTEILMTKYLEQAGKFKISDLDEANEVLKCGMRWWNDSLTTKERQNLEKLPPTKQRDFFKKAPVDFSGVIVRRKFKNIGRNEPCPCSSGKKYKKCCLLKIH